MITLLNYHIEVNDYPAIKQIIKDHKNNLADLNILLNTIEPGRFASPLFLAIEKSQLQIATLLTQWGADVNWQAPSTFMTPLHLACQNLDLKAIELLMNHGANPNITLLYHPVTPFDLAQQATLGLIAQCMNDWENDNTTPTQHQLIDHLFAIKTRLFYVFPDVQIENQP